MKAHDLLPSGFQFFECRSERIGKTPDRSRPAFLVFWLEIEVMHAKSKVLGSFESALDECLVDDHLGGNVRQFTFLPGFDCFRIVSKFRCIRSTVIFRLSEI